MGAYAKTAPGERLTYRPQDLRRYEGEPFCLRITPEDIDLERCFFVYLDEEFESHSVRRLFHSYFVAPKPEQLEQMASWLERWQHVDPLLPKKYDILRQMVSRTQAQGGEVQVFINHGPGPIHLDDSVRDHLGTSVFADGSFNDKILDLVLEFHADEEPLALLEQWDDFRKTDTTGAVGPTAKVTRRRFGGGLAATLVGLFTLPFLLLSCRGRNNANPGGGGGFWGGML